MGRTPRGSVAMLVVAAAWWAGCAYPRHVDFDELSRSGGPSLALAGDGRGAEDQDADDAALAKRAEVAPMVRLALARNPELLEARARVEERLARVPGTARLPDLELRYEQWGVPLGRPYALDDADTLMIGVRQSFPAYGSRDADQRAVLEDARAAFFELRARQLDVVRQVKRAYLEYYLAGREYQVHVEHLALTSRVLELSRDLFRVGRIGEQDVLRLQLEVSEQHRDLAAVQQRQHSAAAMLNTLMGRSPDAALGPAAALSPRELHLDRKQVEDAALAHRPELVAGKHAVLGRQAGVEKAERAASWPTLMLGLDYMYMPADESPHRYGAMVSINLPWLNGKYQDDLELAHRGKVAETRALDAETSAIRYQLRDAWGRYEAALEAYRVTSGDVLPAAQRSFDAAQAAFGVGRGDALSLLDASRSLLQVRLDEARAQVALEASIADLERAIGTDVADVGGPEGTRP
jgi:cobalt-zinc-cadmium efflux system outer membrane protein